LTPAAAGGTGTYANVDWFGSVVLIDATCNSDTAVVFHGIISSFEIIDDGRTSYVELQAIDPLSIAGRAPTVFPGVLSGGAYQAEAIEELLEGMVNYSTSVLPLLGRTTAVLDAEVLTDRSAGVRVSPVQAYVPGDTNIADMLGTSVMPCGLSFCWSGKIYASGSEARYVPNIVGSDLRRSTPRQFVFTDQTLASGELKYEALDIGWNTDQRSNWARMTSVTQYEGTQTVEVINTSSVETYGAQTFTTSSTAHEYVADMEAGAGGIAYRLGEVSWVPRVLRLTTAQQAESVSATSADLAALLDSTSGLWNEAEITSTLTGASSTTSLSMIVGRSIDATPENTTIDLTLMSAIDMQPFILNNADYGVLNQNRLG
jgi:hypothetical protein